MIGVDAQATSACVGCLDGPGCGTTNLVVQREGNSHAATRAATVAQARAKCKEASDGHNAEREAEIRPGRSSPLEGLQQAGNCNSPARDPPQPHSGGTVSLDALWEALDCNANTHDSPIVSRGFMRSLQQICNGNASTRG